MKDPKEKIIKDYENAEAQEFSDEDGKINNEADEIDSDGSASAFDETENFNEDNFDDLKEK